jgi:hypothetical protein
MVEALPLDKRSGTEVRVASDPENIGKRDLQ